MAYDYETLKVVVEDGVAVVALNRPEKFNALNKKMLAELRPCFEELGLDAEVKVVVLTGTGKAFCAGGDVEEMGKGMLKLDYSGGRFLGKTMQAISGLEKPVICAMNGIAAGGGAGAVLACDMIFASEKAKFSEIYTNIGMVPDMGNMWYLARAVGPYKAKELCFSHELIDAAEMLRIGIAQKVFPAEELMPKTLEYAKNLAKGPSVAYKMLKTIIDRGWGMSFEQFYDLEAFALEIVMQTEDFQEGCDAFFQKRAAVYKGK